MVLLGSFTVRKLVSSIYFKTSDIDSHSIYVTTHGRFVLFERTFWNSVVYRLRLSVPTSYMNIKLIRLLKNLLNQKFLKIIDDIEKVKYRKKLDFMSKAVRKLFVDSLNQQQFDQSLTEFIDNELKTFSNQYGLDVINFVLQKLIVLVEELESSGDNSLSTFLFNTEVLNFYEFKFHRQKPVIKDVKPYVGLKSIFRSKRGYDADEYYITIYNISKNNKLASPFVFKGTWCHLTTDMTIVENDDKYAISKIYLGNSRGVILAEMRNSKYYKQQVLAVAGSFYVFNKNFLMIVNELQHFETNLFTEVAAEFDVQLEDNCVEQFFSEEVQSDRSSRSSDSSDNDDDLIDSYISD